MIPQFARALSNGFTTKQVIDFLIKKFPQHSDKIKSALAAGFTSDQVIKFLSGGKKALNEESQPTSEHEQARGIDTKRRENVNKAGLAAGGLAATALASPMAFQALKHAIPQNLLGSIPQASQPEQAISQGIIENQTQQPPVSEPNIPQQKAPIQPEVKSIDIGGLLEKSGLKKHVDELAKTGETAKQITGRLYLKFPKEMKKIQKQTGKKFEDAIGDYLGQNPVGEKMKLTEDPRYSGKIEDIEEKKLFHQTTKEAREKIEKEGFKLGEGEKNDIELPSGIYLKPSQARIDLPGNEQIEVNAKLGKTIHFKDREDYTKYLRNNNKNYDSIYKEFLEIQKKEQEYLDYLDKNPDSHIDEEKLNNFDKKITELAKKGRKEATEFFKNKKINSLHIQRDSGGTNLPGGATETYIALEPEQAKISKGSTVASPNGIGEVKEIRNGQALIDIDGKLHKAQEEELIQSPLPEKELADLYNDVITGIEKETGQQVSRNVYWAGYDPNTNELAYLPHDGGLYIYDDISPEDAKELTNILSQRKSTGQNYIGAWEKGTKSPIGAQMYQLIQRLQKERGGKGNEYANKFQKVYDALEIAKIAAKKQYEEQRKKKAKKPRID